eukprot:Lithocolla_globosa_v1_NODE_922_length_3078_cov_9.231558.p2 type:complete len:250 gc:universal NODE_922_length_3078_cov_9.231558:1231-1980(+)
MMYVCTINVYQVKLKVNWNFTQVLTFGGARCFKGFSQSQSVPAVRFCEKGSTRSGQWQSDFIPCRSNCPRQTDFENDVTWPETAVGDNFSFSCQDFEQELYRECNDWSEWQQTKPCDKLYGSSIVIIACVLLILLAFFFYLICYQVNSQANNTIVVALVLAICNRMLDSLLIWEWLGNPLYVNFGLIAFGCFLFAGMVNMTLAIFFVWCNVNVSTEAFQQHKANRIQPIKQSLFWLLGSMVKIPVSRLA